MRKLDAPAPPPVRPGLGHPAIDDPAPASTPPLVAGFSASARSELADVQRLLLAPHTPLRFAAAQIMWALAPLTALLGLEGVARWAAQMEATDSHPGDQPS